MHHFTLIHIQILSFWGVSPYWNCVNYPFSFVPSGIILCFHTFQLTHSIYYFSCVLHFRGCWILMWICYFLSLLHTGHPSAALRFSSLLLGSSFTLIFLGCILKEFSQKRRFSPFLSLQMILFCWQVTIVHFFFFLGWNGCSVRTLELSCFILAPVLAYNFHIWSDGCSFGGILLFTSFWGSLLHFQAASDCSDPCTWRTWVCLRFSENFCLSVCLSFKITFHSAASGWLGHWNMWLLILGP